jgi:hypothetical protein
MINNWLLSYTLIGLLIVTLVEYGYDKKRKGDPNFQFDGGDITWGSRIITVALWPVVVTIAIVLSIRDKRKNDGYGKH